MTMLSINHAAKGIVMWTWATTPWLADLTSKLGKILINDCTEPILASKLFRNLKVLGGKGIDVSIWVGAEEILVSIVNPVYEAQSGPLAIELPDGVEASSVSSVLWGTGWQVSTSSSLTRQSVSALSVDLFKLVVKKGGSTNLSPETPATS